MLRCVTPTAATVWVETRRSVHGGGPRNAARRRSAWRATTTRSSWWRACSPVRPPSTPSNWTVVSAGRDRTSELPASRIRTPTADGTHCRVVFGSCRIAAPHEPPWSLELSTDHRGRGVDALYVYATRMAGQAPEEWPRPRRLPRRPGVCRRLVAGNARPDRGRRAADADEPAVEDLPPTSSAASRR